MDTINTKHFAYNDGYDLEMYVSFCLDSFKMLGWGNFSSIFLGSWRLPYVIFEWKKKYYCSSEGRNRLDNYKTFILFDEYATEFVGFPDFGW